MSKIFDQSPKFTQPIEMSNYSAKHIRNIAIIAHVDHGKTTLVDGLVRQNLQIRNVSSLGDLIMDSMDQERERGITIKAKNASVYHVHSGSEYKINIVDTPGHADFGGEVERALQMVDGACLLVDAQEGPMPQTRYVMRKAIQQGLRIIVIINKVDKSGADCQKTLSKIEDLFLDMGASDLQMDFPVIYAIGVQGKAGPSKDDLKEDLTYFLDKVVMEIPAPEVVNEDLKKQLVAEFSTDLIEQKILH
jgi:GTP-binding protein